MRCCWCITMMMLLTAIGGAHGRGHDDGLRSVCSTIVVVVHHHRHHVDADEAQRGDAGAVRVPLVQQRERRDGHALHDGVLELGRRGQRSAASSLLSLTRLLILPQRDEALRRDLPHSDDARVIASDQHLLCVRVHCQMSQRLSVSMMLMLLLMLSLIKCLGSCTGSAG